MSYEIKEITRPTNNNRGRKGELKEKLLQLKPNSNQAVPLKANQSSSAYAAAKAANLSVFVHKMVDGNIAVFSNGPRQ